MNSPVFQVSIPLALISPLVAASIRRLVDSPELAARISLAARVRVIERFSEDAMVDRTIAAYDRVMMV